MARFRRDSFGCVRPVARGLAARGDAGSGPVVRRVVRLARLAMARFGDARFRRVWLGKVRRGSAGNVRRGVAGFGRARRGRFGEV
jgi:hypothetical protein